MSEAPSESKVVWITGASAGIGVALAKEFGQRGYDLVLTARRAEKLADVKAELEAMGCSALAVAADVCNGDELAKVPDAVAEAWGSSRIDIAIANAGVLYYGETNSLDVEDEVRTIDVNVSGLIRTVRVVLSAMLARDSGQIVGISSLAGIAPLPQRAAYVASKAAVQYYLRSLALELHRTNVGVTVVSPGYVESEMTDDVKESLPMIWPVKKAAKTMVDGIVKRRAEITFPWPLAAGLRTAKALPKPLRDYFLRKQTVKR